MLPDPNEAGVGPFDRAIILAQDLVTLKMDPTQLSNRLHIHAKQWETAYNFADSNRDYSLGRVIAEAQLFVRDVRGQASNQLNMVNNNASLKADAELRKGYENRAAALTRIADEVDARVSDMRRKSKDPAPFPGT